MTSDVLQCRSSGGLKTWWLLIRLPTVLLHPMWTPSRAVSITASLERHLGHKIDGEKTYRSYQPMPPPTCPLPGTLTSWGEGKTNWHFFRLWSPSFVYGPSKIMHKRRPTNLGFHPASKRRLADIAALFLSVNHVYYRNFRERVR